MLSKRGPSTTTPTQGRWTAPYTTHTHSHHIDNKQIRAALAPNAPTFTILAWAKRLRYLTRLLNTGSTLLLRLTFHHDPITKWELTVRTDLIWLRLYNDKLSELPDPLPIHTTPSELQPWLGLARDHKAPWKAFIRHAIRATCQEDAVGVPSIPSLSASKEATPQTQPPTTPTSNGDRRP